MGRRYGQETISAEKPNNCNCAGQKKYPYGALSSMSMSLFAKTKPAASCAPIGAMDPPFFAWKVTTRSTGQAISPSPHPAFTDRLSAS
jgi:hypothetical protein